MSKDLCGRTALVTGASRGIGAVIASRLAAEGAAVVITARTTRAGDHLLPGSLEEVEQRIRQSGGTALAVPADLTIAFQRKRVLDLATKRFGGIDIVVNNAAVSWFVPSIEMSEKRVRLMYEVLLHVPLMLAQATVPTMAERGYGRIINVSSPASHHPPGPPFPAIPSPTVYGMFKAALERFTSGLAAETYASGVGVACVAPQKLVVTEAAAHHGWDRQVPADRREPASVTAEAVAALCSARLDDVTGRSFYSGQLLEKLGLEVPTT